MKTRTLLLMLLWFCLVMTAVIGLFWLTLGTENVYYAQVDNERVVERVPRHGMYYTYELPAFDQAGEARTLSFETSRILRDGAYLKITVAPIRGVTAWEEVDFDAIPFPARLAIE